MLGCFGFTLLRVYCTPLVALFACPKKKKKKKMPTISLLTSEIEIFILLFKTLQNLIEVLYFSASPPAARLDVLDLILN